MMILTSRQASGCPLSSKDPPTEMKTQKMAILRQDGLTNIVPNDDTDI